jgi:hypothetical protein
MDFDYNHLMWTGQSLSNGSDSLVPLSTNALHGNVMIGSSVGFYPHREKTFMPLKTYKPEGRNMENPVFGAANYLGKLYADRNGPPRAIVASSTGTAGLSIEELTKGGPWWELEDDWKQQARKSKWYRWGLMPAAVRHGKEIADALGKSYGVIALCWVQGESNYGGVNNRVTTKEGYKKKLKDYRNNFIKECVKGIAGQKGLPAFVTYQTGGAYSSDYNGLAIGMAQWELTLEEPGCYLATPVYPVVDYGGHLTSNGYRWMGAYFGKVLGKTLLERQDWKPLSPRRLSLDGRTIAIDFHVPEPPLVFDGVYVGSKKEDLPNKGFMVIDTFGEVPILSLRIVLDTIVEIVCARDFVGPVYVRYAGKEKFDGNGNLRDSDPAVAEDVYVFEPGAPNRPDENIAELVGKPYPLHNWSIAFYLEAKPSPGDLQ